jgi:hypothetical protein
VGTAGAAGTKAGQGKNAASTQATITVTPDRTGDTKSEVLASEDDATSAQEKATRTPQWQNFAPLPTPAPNPMVRAAAIRTSTLRRFLRHEWTLAVVGGLVLSVLLNRGALADPRHTLPQDVWDPSLIAYLIAWGGHALGHDPANLWNLNAFFPTPYGLAFSDSLLGYAPLALFGSGPEAAVLRYNIIFILAQALAFIGAYALARQLGVGRVGGTVAAVAFTVAPWRLGQAGHLHVLSTGGIALALAMLARGHGIRWRGRRVVGRASRWAGEPDPDASTGPDEEPSRPPKRPAWALAGWFVAAWQLTIGFGIGLVFLYVLLATVIVSLAWWGIRHRTLPSWRLLVADGVGGAVFAVVALLLAQPYLKVLELFPNAKRTDAWITLYSPPAWGFVTAPEHSLVWGGLHSGTRGQLSLPGEMSLLPGFTLYALAAAGLVFSIWSIAVRVALLAGVAVSLVLALGTNGPAGGEGGYLFLLHNLPGFEGLRTPGRLIIWTTLLLALLAAGGVGALVSRAGEVAHRRGLPRPTTLARLALLLPVALVLAEGIGTTPHQPVPAAPAALSNIDAPFLVLPTDEIRDESVMLWSTDGFPALVNGGSGFVPADLDRTRKTVASFPDVDSITYLRDLGVHTVVLLRSQAAGTAWENAAEQPVDDLGITREEIDDTVVFHLKP